MTMLAFVFSSMLVVGFEPHRGQILVPLGNGKLVFFALPLARVLGTRGAETPA
jgi:hypothetical protein